MTTFKFGLSLFLMALASLCFSLPVDLPTTEKMILSSTEEQHSVRTAEVNEILSSSPLTENDTISPLTSSNPLQNEKSGSMMERSTENGTVEATSSVESRSIKDIIELDSTVSNTTMTQPSKRNHEPNHLDSVQTEEMLSETTAQSKDVPVEPTVEEHTVEMEMSSMSSEMAMTTFKISPTTESLMMETTEKPAGKFLGLLEDEEEKSPNKPKKLMKLPKAEFDPQAVELISGLPSNRMFHEENKVSVKNSPQPPKSDEQNEDLEHELDETTDKIENPKSLDQGEDEPVSEEEKSDH